MNRPGRAFPRIKKWGLFLACLVFAPSTATLADDQSSELGRFTRALEIIRSNYADEEGVDYRDLIDHAIDGMLSSRDADSAYLPPPEFVERRDDHAGQFGGLGIVISIRNEHLVVAAPLDGTPGHRAGLMSGDRIVEIDGRPTQGTSLQEAVRAMRGEPGTKVRLKIMRRDELKDVEITREVVVVESVRDAGILESGIGYVRITQFNAPTPADLEKALSELKGEGLEALVLDLRSNPGGLLVPAVDAAGLFLAKGKNVVTSKGRDPRRTRPHQVTRDPAYPNLPLVVLVNDGTAGATEAFAAALRDHGRAALVGQKTFGRGSTQSIFPLEDGGAIRLTTGYFYTPAGERIHEVGIEPDVRVEMSPEQWRDIQLARVHREVPSPDPQLERAVDLLKTILEQEGE